MSSATLAVLTHPADRFTARRYFLRLLIERWRSFGIRAVVVDDPDAYVPADLAILHVDVSVMPSAWRRLAERYPHTLNGRVLDIRRRRFSRLLLEPGDPHPGMTIVKTDNNYGGVNDVRHAVVDSRLGRLLPRSGRRESILRAFTRLEMKRSWRRRRVLASGHYPVFASLQAVPAAVWRNPHLVIERFLPERSNGSYSCRHWAFLGDREVHRRSTSPYPVVKAQDSRIEPLDDPVPDELRAVRRELGFDYGKFDYAIVDGEVALFDVNPTLTTARDLRVHAVAVEVLGDGIRAFLAGSNGPA